MLLTGNAVIVMTIYTELLFALCYTHSIRTQLRTTSAEETCLSR